MQVKTLIQQIQRLPLKERFIIVEQTIQSIKNEELKQLDMPEFKSPALQGKMLTNQEFLNWIEQAENANSINLPEAKTKWSKNRNQLEKLIK